MASRFISVILFILALATLIASTVSMFDPLFLFLSDNPITGGIRLAASASLLAVSMRNITKPQAIAAVNGIGVALIVFGLATFFSNSMGWALYNYSMPLDSSLLLNAGIIFSLVSLKSSPVQREKDYYTQLQKHHLKLRNKLT